MSDLDDQSPDGDPVLGLVMAIGVVLGTAMALGVLFWAAFAL